MGRAENQPIAERLREAARILEEQQANPFRVRAYRRAADTVAELDEDFHTDSEPEGQRTVVTETRGPLAGQRVVRGREGDCRAHYAARETPTAARRAGGVG
ncbi:MAG: hypothetical protein HYU25_18930 [Candidatus Rokubacteria bacterium]|nr:hypothetical protein [Candidatus Rokubacteria bacterium]